ncbi:hypothetical protein CDV36_012225 [Fusarium kuroshium]|uniref:Uncharacterized protein n=1 Tax=Fusarium kuroshium TaxID=2010991 RepID=A0A3M2RS79_9HYPO|nr:hypothetical protein CDV36_012225 [Fusarium kuroshium]
MGEWQAGEPVIFLGARRVSIRNSQGQQGNRRLHLAPEPSSHQHASVAEKQRMQLVARYHWALADNQECLTFNLAMQCRLRITNPDTLDLPP